MKDAGKLNLESRLHIKSTLQTFETQRVCSNHERLAKLLPLIVCVAMVMLGVAHVINDIDAVKWINALLFIYILTIYLAIKTLDRLKLEPKKMQRGYKAIQWITSGGLLLWGTAMLGYKPDSVISYFDFVIVLVITGVIIHQSLIAWVVQYIMVIVYLLGLTPFLSLNLEDPLLTCISIGLFLMTSFYINYILQRQAKVNYDIESELLKQKQTLEVKVEEKTKALMNAEKRMTKEVALLLTVVMEHYDEYTKGHSESVATISRELARAIGFDFERQNEIYWAGLIHDIGKIRVDKTVLNKADSLTVEEFDQIKNHSVYGYEMTSKSESLKRIAVMIRHHHEWYDGSGYPDGLSGDAIPVESQIIAIADAWDVMCSDRVYRKKMTLENARLELIKNSGSQFSPQYVAIFLDLECANE